LKKVDSQLKVEYIEKKKKKKDRVLSVHVMKAYDWNRATDPHILSLGVIWR